MIPYFRKLLYEPFANLLSTDTIWTKIVVAIVAFFAPVKLYAISIFLLVIIDVVTGLWASIKRGHSFRSRTLMNGLIIKVALYGMLFTGTIVMGNVLQSVLHYKVYYLAWAFTVLISVYELSSIIENVIVIKPELAFLTKLKTLLTNVQDKEMEKVQKMIKTKPETKK